MKLNRNFTLAILLLASNYLGYASTTTNNNNRRLPRGKDGGLIKEGGRGNGRDKGKKEDKGKARPARVDPQDDNRIEPEDAPQNANELAFAAMLVSGGGRTDANSGGRGKGGSRGSKLLSEFDISSIVLPAGEELSCDPQDLDEGEVCGLYDITMEGGGEASRVVEMVDDGRSSPVGSEVSDAVDGIGRGGRGSSGADGNDQGGRGHGSKGNKAGIKAELEEEELSFEPLELEAAMEDEIDALLSVYEFDAEDYEAELIEAGLGMDVEVNETIAVDGEVDLDEEVFSRRLRSGRKVSQEQPQSQRKLQNLETRNIGTFAPLTCNGVALPTASECESSPAGLMSELVSQANGGEVVVPCGRCYKVSSFVIALHSSSGISLRTSIITIVLLHTHPVRSPHRSHHRWSEHHRKALHSSQLQVYSHNYSRLCPRRA